MWDCLLAHLRIEEVFLVSPLDDDFVSLLCGSSCWKVKVVSQFCSVLDHLWEFAEGGVGVVVLLCILHYWGKLEASLWQGVLLWGSSSRPNLASESFDSPRWCTGLQVSGVGCYPSLQSLPLKLVIQEEPVSMLLCYRIVFPILSTVLLEWRQDYRPASFCNYLFSVFMWRHHTWKLKITFPSEVSVPWRKRP